MLHVGAYAKVVLTPMEEVVSNFGCPTHGRKTGNYCSSCGQKLTETTSVVQRTPLFGQLVGSFDTAIPHLTDAYTKDNVMYVMGTMPNDGTYYGENYNGDELKISLPYMVSAIQTFQETYQHQLGQLAKHGEVSIHFGVLSYGD